MYSKKCYMTIDKDVTFFGLEVEDILVIFITSSAIMFIINPIIAVIFGLIAVFTLRKLKDGKPPGHMFYLLYKTGILMYMPSFLRYPHLVKPPDVFESMFGNKKIIKFSCVGDEDEDKKDPFEKFYWSERKTM